MKILTITLLSFLFAYNLYAQQSKWYKGNLHTHSLWSDGDDYPEMIIDWYKQHGYDFIALSDHNILAEGEKWIEIDSAMQNTYKKYLKKFGENWVETKTVNDTLFVRLKTLEEYRKLFEEPGKFLIIKSEEITDRFEKKPIHVNATNIQSLIKPQGGKSVFDVIQNDVNAINEQKLKTSKPMFPHVNHPNFGWAITADDLIKLHGDKFFEVYNGHPLVNNYGDSTHIGMEKMWDIILTARLTEGKDVMFGLAVDDAHHYSNFVSRLANPGRGWVVVKTDSLNPKSLIDAMEKGDFYSSTGVELKDISIDENSIKISVKPEEGINYNIRFIGTIKNDSAKSETGKLLKEVSGVEGEYNFKGDELYVRATIISSKLKENPYREGEHETAWVQPVVRKFSK